MVACLIFSYKKRKNKSVLIRTSIKVAKKYIQNKNLCSSFLLEKFSALVHTHKYIYIGIKEKRIKVTILK